MLISKKELLEETGISYGQLYRWKREGLIPEDWFIKRPAFTGQETFFPKTKILNRIRAIQSLKDKYSLEELAKILSPVLSERSFTKADLDKIEEIDKGLIPCFCRCFEKEAFSYVELLVLAALSRCKREFDLSLYAMEDICEGLKGRLDSIRQTEYLLLLLEKEKKYFVLLHEENAAVLFDARFTVVGTVRLHDISTMLKLKYRTSFQFQLEGEEEDENNAPLLGFSEGGARA